MTIAQRLATKMHDKKWSEGELGRRSGVPQPTINRITSGESQSPRRNNIEKLARSLGVTPEWLLFGGPYDGGAEAGPGTRRKVPVVSWETAGALPESVIATGLVESPEWMLCPVSHGARSYVVRIRGESMFNPQGRQSFREGDVVFIDPGRKAVHGSLIVARVVGQPAAFFRKLLIESGERYLQALNPAWPNQIVLADASVTICGVAIFRGEVL